MGVEVQQLIDIITKMQASQEAANARFDEHLTRLRENIHEMKNDYHGVASLSQITHEKVKEIHVQVEKETTGIHSRIDKTNDEIELIKNEISEMKPTTNVIKQFGSNAMKVITGLVIGAVVWVIVKMSSE